MRVRPWAAVTGLAATALVASLALPWVLTWKDGRVTGAEVLLLPDGPRWYLGPLVLLLWGVAVAGTVRGTRLAWCGALAAAALAAMICLVFYGSVLGTGRSFGIGEDESGNVIEWIREDRKGPGFHVAATAGVLLCVGILMRGRSVEPPLRWRRAR
ncbi:hypothetical protein J2S43_002330 [Catenuloplanes nepalensis]|uniref:Uncharacterized protein n=1 Tax=Catenuloplanes nepalensis TaxID=587533 RepID=A0ABT9MRB3_9ACTN|nr:hypothetical protein [Catenuloplanes nepalensis]MDP9793818.1 hypothetical protein [Catenuloplanes nepalensis]